MLFNLWTARLKPERDRDVGGAIQSVSEKAEKKRPHFLTSLEYALSRLNLSNLTVPGPHPRSGPPAIHSVLCAVSINGTNDKKVVACVL